MQRKFSDYIGTIGRVWLRMSTSNITHGFWSIVLAALIAGVLDISISYLRAEESVTLLALGFSEAAPEVESGFTLDPISLDSTAQVVVMTEPVDTAVLSDPVIQHPLYAFFQALTQLQERGGQVRIGYFGDSMIEGDLVTQSLRHDLQAQFGGTGVGFVPITSQTYGFRKSIYHRFSSDWKDFNLLAPKAPEHEYGISGEYFLTRRPGESGRTWVRYKGEELYPGTERFEQVRLFYGRRHEGEAAPGAYVMVHADQREDTLPLSRNDLVNDLLVSQQPTEEITLNFEIPRDLPVYGLSFESPEGVFVDNFASRGNSGMNLVEIPGETLAEFHQTLDYDLIVLQFGLNVISSRRKDFSSYEAGMERVIRHFQTHVPDAAILLVSCSDKSTQLRGRLQTDPSVPLIVAAQERVASSTGIAFLDLYQAMGGRNAMIQWVRNDLARSDYTHPNRKGAERVSHIVRDYLLAQYQQRENGEEAEPPSFLSLQ